MMIEHDLPTEQRPSPSVPKSLWLYLGAAFDAILEGLCRYNNRQA